MRRTQWIILLVIFWSVLVIKNIPAQWGVWFANPPAQMSGVSGTLWAGKAATVVLPYPNGAFSLGEFSWSLRPLSVLTLNPCAEFIAELSDQSISGVACSTVGGDLELSDVEITVPAAAAEVWMPVSIRGEFFAKIDTLKISNNAIVALSGQGSWSDARYHNSQVWMDIGSMAFDLQADGAGGMRATVEDIEGPMGLDIISTFSLNGAYDIRGDIELRPNAPQEIAQLLTIIAKQVSQDRYRFEWVGS
ncbi:GspN family type II secretion system protein ExeN [Aurantivibrio plasticivorans]